MFLVSSSSRIDDLPQKMGLALYSYGFVAKLLSPVLERLGQWRQVIAPESSLIHAAAQAIEEGFRPVHLAVAPVQGAYLTPAVPTILFPFWEFPRIPDQDFGWETRHNWARVARRASLIVTASEMTARSFRDAGVGCPVEVVPVPVADEAFRVPAWSRDFTWRINCRHVSLGGPPVIPGEPAPAEPIPPKGRLARWKAAVKGRYKRSIRPWLPPRAQQWVSQANLVTQNAVRRREPIVVPLPPRIPACLLELSGLVYTSIFNPADLRKNPKEMLSAFLLAFKDRADVTLVLKLAAIPEHEWHVIAYLRILHQQLAIEHRCRVVIITDYLSEDELLGLFRATTYYVNASQAEGACLPLTQALACGRPAIAPAHTAMADYMDDRVGFVIPSQPEPTHWPHDPQRRVVTTWHRPDWSILLDQFLRSADVANWRREEYDAMAGFARHRMMKYASANVVTTALERVLDQLGQPRLGALAWEDGRAA
jgi:glycosyltransferase involved in cell wall biosynthesis